MQNVVVDTAYRFVPPARGTFWARLLSRLVLPRYLRSRHGVELLEIRGVERLRASVEAGHGIMLAANHCRPCDPMVLFRLGLAVDAPVHVMASRHLFAVSRLQTWVLQQMGVFSVHREGMDREALTCAVGILSDARRPLVLFPEGVVTRSNDRLGHLMDGTAFIARTAARQRAVSTPAGRVVLHPVAIRYFLMGDVDSAVQPVLADTERRLSWRPQADLPLRDRVVKVGEALLTLKEIEYLGRPQGGDLATRLQRLIDRLLVPLEDEWLGGRSDGSIVARVKALRMAIVPDMVAETIDEAERARRWRQLEDVYLAQQLWCYPPDYFSAQPTPEQLLETVERYEEDLTDRSRAHGPLRAVVEVGGPIAVEPGRGRGGNGELLMSRIRGDLEAMLERLRGQPRIDREVRR
jgi:1-acyl-sn-glycerol-3-phosphate acyltransferase